MKNNKPLLLVLFFLASALMLTMIQAPLGWSFLAWVALVPFVVACSPQFPWRRLALLAYGVSFFYWLGNLYWIAPITIIGWVAMCFYMALLWPLLALAVCFCRAKGFPLFLAVPILVVGAERLQGFPLGGFYWRFLGHSQYANLTLIQIADVFGAAGVSFVVAMVNGLLADLAIVGGRARQGQGCRPWRWPRPFSGSPSASGACRCQPAPVAKQSDCLPGDGNRPSGRTVVLGAVLTSAIVLGTVLYGHWRLRETQRYVEAGPLVAALQSNVPQSVKRSFKASENLFEKLMAKSKAAAALGAQLIVWPETMVQGFLQPELWSRLPKADWEEDKAFHLALSQHAKGSAHVLVGAFGGEILPGFDGKYYLGQYNSAYLYHPDGARDPQRYDKIHLVLFGEYIPFRKRFNWLYQQLRKFTPKEYNYDYSLEHGTHYTVFDMATPIGNVDRNGAERPAEANEPNAVCHFGVIICYEDSIPYVARHFVLDEHGRKRIDWLVNISNDGWFVRFLGDSTRSAPSTELPQHAAICAFRAVENRLPILRSVNTGISCLIDSTGKIRDGYLAASAGFPFEAMQRTGMAGWFLDRMPIDRRVSFYSRHGEWLAMGCAIAFVVAVAWPFGARLIGGRLSGKAKRDAQ